MDDSFTIKKVDRTHFNVFYKGEFAGNMVMPEHIVKDIISMMNKAYQVGHANGFGEALKRIDSEIPNIKDINVLLDMNLKAMNEAYAPIRG